MAFWVLVFFLLPLLGWNTSGYTQEPAQEANPYRTGLFDWAVPFSRPIETDRPTFSLSPATVPRGHIQFETGYTFTYEYAHPDVATHTFPETLIRIGLTETAEFRMEWPTLTFIENGKDVHGFRDLGLGFKTQIFQQQGLRPRLSFAGRLSIPTGDKDFSSDRLDPELRTILTYALDERVGLFGTVNIAGPSSQGKRFVQVSSSLGLSATIGETVSGFIEYFGLYPVDVAQGSGNFLQTGLVYHLTYDIQLDARVGGGLNNGNDEMLSGAGLSWRF